MADAWTSETLGDILPGMAGCLDDISGESKTLYRQVTSVISNMQTRAGQLNNVVGSSDRMIDKMAAAGFYTLWLTPGTGGWASRALAAAGAPSNSGCSAGVLIVIQAPNVEPLLTKYENLYDIFHDPIPIP
jgi:hypothetical protein